MNTIHIDDKHGLLQFVKVEFGKSPVEQVILVNLAPILKGCLATRWFDLTLVYVENVVRKESRGWDSVQADDGDLLVDESDSAPTTGGAIKTVREAAFRQLVVAIPMAIQLTVPSLLECLDSGLFKEIQFRQSE